MHKWGECRREYSNVKKYLHKLGEGGENIQISKSICTNWVSVGEKAASQLAGNSGRRYLNTDHRHAGAGEALNSYNYQIHFNFNQSGGQQGHD